MDREVRPCKWQKQEVTTGQVGLARSAKRDVNERQQQQESGETE